MSSLEDRDFPPLTEEAEAFLETAVNELKSDLRGRAQVAASRGGLTSEPASVRHVALVLSRVRVTDELDYQRTERERRLLRVVGIVSIAYGILGVLLKIALKLGWLPNAAGQLPNLVGLLLGATVPTLAYLLFKGVFLRTKALTAYDVSSYGSLAAMFIERWIRIEQIIRAAAGASVEGRSPSAVPLSQLIRIFTESRSSEGDLYAELLTLLRFRNRVLHDPSSVTLPETERNLRNADRILARLGE